jgi:hypothetical protein
MTDDESMVVAVVKFPRVSDGTGAQEYTYPCLHVMYGQSMLATPYLPASWEGRLRPQARYRANLMEVRRLLNQGDQTITPHL